MRFPVKENKPSGSSGIDRTFQEPKSGNIMTFFVKELIFLKKPTWKDSQDLALIEARLFGLNAVYEAVTNGEA